LKLWATLIGHTGVEVFPKQDRMDAGGAGSWINAPYFGGDRSVRYAYGLNGSLTVDEFLDLAESFKVSRRWLEEWRPKEQPVLDEDSEWYGGPPCLQALTADGKMITQGGRNNAFFNVCRYLSERYGQGWQSRVADYAHHFDPPLRADEMRDTIRSVGRRSFGYICDRPPCSNVCDRPTCLERPFGVKGAGERGADQSILKLGALQKILTEPPTYRISIDDKWAVDLSAEELMNQQRFWLCVMQVTDRIGTVLKPSLWRKLLEQKLDDVEHVYVSEESTLKGDVVHHLAGFCKVKARAFDEILKGKAWTEDGWTNFVPSDFMEYLHVRKVPYTNQKLTVIMHDHGMKEKRAVIKGKSIAYWSVPEPSLQTESFDVPKSDPEEPF
jgi:hypothetical protein